MLKSQFGYSPRRHRFLEVSLSRVAFCIMQLHMTDPLALHVSFPVPPVKELQKGTGDNEHLLDIMQRVSFSAQNLHNHGRPAMFYPSNTI